MAINSRAFGIPYGGTFANVTPGEMYSLCGMPDASEALRETERPPLPFAPGDRVRVRAEANLDRSLEGKVGVVDCVLEGLQQCDVRFAHVPGHTVGFKWHELERASGGGGTMTDTKLAGTPADRFDAWLRKRERERRDEPRCPLPQLAPPAGWVPQAGDRVCVNQGRLAGRIGEVIDSSDEGLLRVRIDGEGMVKWHVDNVLPVVTPQPAEPPPTRPFRVGDRVRVEGGTGSTGTVTTVYTLGACEVLIDGESRSRTFSPENLRRIKDVLTVSSPTPEPGETWAATLELAGGRVVEIPGPDPAVWEQVGEDRWDVEADVRASIGSISNKITGKDVELRYVSSAASGERVCGTKLLSHDEARCWAHDMARVVNAASDRGARLLHLRRYRRRAPVDPHAGRPYPTLRAFLW